MSQSSTMAPSQVNLGPLAAIPPGEGRQYQVGEQAIAVIRTRGDQLYAVQAHCPHKQGPLADGIVGQGKLVCPLHQYGFDLATGQALRPDCEHLRTWVVAVDDALDIILTVG